MKLSALCLGLLLTTATATDRPPPPSAAFIAGFEAGVRYGLIARLQHPTEDSIPVLTALAKRYYYMIVVQPQTTE